MEYRNLVTFLRVAELQNFTQAANSLGYAQSTVTFHIQSLEEELGVTLFDRVGKKISLTMAGEYLIHYANKMVELESGIRDLNKNIAHLPGTLRVGVVESLLSTYAAETVPRFHRENPQITMELRTASSMELMEMLRSNEADLILITGKRMVDPGFVRDLLKPIHLSFVASPRNPLSDHSHVTLPEIAEQPLILPERDSLYRRTAEEIAAQFDCILTPSVQISNTAVILDLLEHGVGISFLPDYLTHTAIREGKLSILPVDPELLPDYYIQILHHKNKWISPQMQSFIDMIQDVLGDAAQ